MSIQAWDRFERIAASRCGATALVQGSRRMSFDYLRRAGLQWAARLDVAPGGRVVVSAANGAAPAAAILGIWRLGAIPVLVHAAAPDRHLAHAARLTDAASVLVDPDRSVPDVDAPVLWTDRTDAGDLPPPAPRQSGAEPASILFTSGSSGPPKGVTQSAATLIDGADRVADLMGYGRGDSILCGVPFAFDYGWGQLLSTFFRGVPLVLPERRDAFGLCEAMASHRPTVLAGVPALFADLLAGMSPIAGTDRGSIRLITSTGSKVPGPVWSALVGTFPDAEIALNYGLTETYRSACLPPSLARAHPGSVGFALPGVDLAIVRPDGTRCVADEEGEIVHRGAGAFLGYWGEPERTAATLRPDPAWTHGGVNSPTVVFTGDLGRMDGAGLLYVHGRRDRQMKSMGVRVAPDEIEALLLESGLLTEVAVAARANDTLGDMIVAFVVRKEATSDLKALKRHARAVMSPYMQPREWVVLDRLPRLPSGKVDYPTLERQACGEVAA